MSFIDWIYSQYPNPSINGQWGWLHILTLVLCITIIVTFSLLFRKKSQKTKYIVIWALVGIIIAFEISRRVINLCRPQEFTTSSLLYLLLPRPWCAIACWTLILAVIVNKKFLYNFGAFTALICALIFFAYPGVGFNNQYILFENLYSIGTHSLLLVISILLMTLGFTKFEYKNIWKEAICYVIVLAYALLEIYVLKIEADPMYFMPNNDVQDILGISYGLYLALYIIFMFVYINMFYLIDDRKNVFKRRYNKK